MKGWFDCEVWPVTPVIVNEYHIAWSIFSSQLTYHFVKWIFQYYAGYFYLIPIKYWLDVRTSKYILANMILIMLSGHRKNGYQTIIWVFWYCRRVFNQRIFRMFVVRPGSAFIKRDHLDPWIKDQLRNDLLSTILSLQLPNFASCGRACPSHMTQNLVTVGVKLLIGEWFLSDPWSMDQADLVW